MPTTPTWLRQYGAAARILIVMTVLVGLIYPLAMTGIAQLLFPSQANGSLIRNDEGEVVGSALIGQNFDGDAWFHTRPSAAGDEGYDGGSSSASNLGPNSEELLQQIEDRKAQVADREGVDEDEVPADAVTASGSGLDPHISPDYAAIQTRRVAAARGMSVEEVEKLVAEHTVGRSLGFIGEPGVNVIDLNLALEDAH
ncbi:K(+)-transporting ATPase subunit C [Nocardiopsis gilva YIM 90087]|uniref:Potassium-transporting ATPase KdpC subunit n=1 Tax=Nocardiopsis gilva YIM 90087 TaxID=1235441 RepID=A0A223SB28_9ACTN|nr:K(+)-transporting ATPase subunit C [Nocardiopsis gilva]ASU85357.1 K(+)-transporting ATPase subunit C [Nocardiopsis gilva YIM 90087]